ncbi:hypothetical protein QBC44DRAFT_392051 [Cladorrhinum sp. PSN332]|nr:hypothetical protein QBC44DRAFT_392051 [Cladorrhinum sp. PSN332]
MKLTTLLALASTALGAALPNNQTAIDLLDQQSYDSCSFPHLEMAGRVLHIKPPQAGDPFCCETIQTIMKIRDVDVNVGGSCEPVGHFKPSSHAHFEVICKTMGKGFHMYPQCCHALPPVPIIGGVLLPAKPFACRHPAH